MRSNPIVAHRGWSGIAPENTMAAFRLAAGDGRIGWIELDVQLSSDGVPVVIHDFTLERTTKASGRVRDYTYEQLARLDNGSWFSPEFGNERIPALEQVLIEMKGRVKLNIELKTAVKLYPGLEQAMLELLRRHDWLDDVVITSFDPYALQLVRVLEPHVRTGLIVSGSPMMLLGQLRFAGAGFLSISYRHLNRQLVHELMDQSGIDVMAWTVNEAEAIRRMMDLHPGLMICTNYPDRALAYS